METIDEARTFLDSLADELLADDDPYEQFEILLGIGQDLRTSATDFSDKNLISGCTAQTFLEVTVSPESTLSISGWSDSAFGRSYITIFRQAFTGLKTADFISMSAPIVERFSQRTQVHGLSMTPSRINSFGLIYKAIREEVLRVQPGLA